MESFSFKHAGTVPVKNRAHVGVVGSGDLEIIIEPSQDAGLSIEVRTSADGFQPTWQKVLTRFATENNLMAHIIINDFGATPGVVRLRLAQGIEVSNNIEQ